MPLQIVVGARRGQGTATTLERDVDRPFLVLGVDVGIPEVLEDAERLRFSFRDEQGVQRTSIDVPVGEARRQIRATRLVTLAIASTSLSPGRYELRVSAPDRPEMESFLDASVEVVDDRSDSDR